MRSSMLSGKCGKYPNTLKLKLLEKTILLCKPSHSPFKYHFLLITQYFCASLNISVYLWTVCQSYKHCFVIWKLFSVNFIQAVWLDCHVTNLTSLFLLQWNFENGLICNIKNGASTGNRVDDYTCSRFKGESQKEIYIWRPVCCSADCITTENSQ